MRPMAMASRTFSVRVVSVGSACGMVVVRKHLEGKARNLGDDVMNARREAAGARRLRRFSLRMESTLEIFRCLLTIVR